MEAREAGNLTEEKIEEIDLSKNPILRRELKNDKLGILDVLVQLNQKEQINIEMQIVNKKNIVDRILYYWSKLYTRQLKVGQDYSEAQPQQQKQKQKSKAQQPQQGQKKKKVPNLKANMNNPNNPAYKKKG